MDTPSREYSPGINTLITTIATQPYQFGFFQLVRLIQLLQELTPESTPESTSLNQIALPVQFKTWITLAHPSSEVHAIQEGETDSDLLRVSIAFMGLLGPLGVLPPAYTEYAILQERKRDEVFQDFCDIFTNQSARLFYQAWSKYRLPILFEQNKNNTFGTAFASIVGAGTTGILQRTGLPEYALYAYAGRLGHRPVSVSTIEALLSDFFQTQVVVEQFKETRYRLSPTEQSRFGRSNMEIGTTTILGTTNIDRQSKLRLVFGPLTFQEFQLFLPGGKNFLLLQNWMFFLTGHQFLIDLQLVLRKEEVPKLQFQAQRRFRRTAWLVSKEVEMDDKQAVYALIQ